LLAGRTARTISGVAHFPDVGGFVLSGRRVRLPADLPSGLVVVAFKMWHQRLVDEWIAWAEQNHPDLPVVEVPVISRAFRWQRPFIDGGMIAGIRDRTVLARTITVYTDVGAFLRALDLPDDSTVAALLTGPDGVVSAQVRGPLDTDVARTVLSPAIEPGAPGRAP
jgi:hypothetical protein